MATNGVNLIDEHDTGRVFFRLIKHIAHTRCAHADKHFDEVRAGHAEKRYARFARNRFGEQSFTCAGRPDQQNTVRNIAAEFLEFLRVFEKIHDFFHFLFGLVTAGNVVEIDVFRAVVLQTRFRFTHRHHAVFTAVHLTHHEKPQSDQ